MKEKFEIPNQRGDFEKRMSGKTAGKKGEGFVEIINNKKQTKKEKDVEDVEREIIKEDSK